MSMEKFIYKIVIGGAGGVGKTTLLLRYLQGIFKEDTGITIGVSFFNKSVQRSGAFVNLAIWDLGGQERFRVVQPHYVLGAKAAIVFFDMARPETMQQIKEWVTMFRDNVHTSIPIILCGTKQDLLQQESVKKVYNEAVKAVDILGLDHFYPTSAKNGLNVEAVFNHIVDFLLSQVVMENPEIAAVL